MTKGKQNSLGRIYIRFFETNSDKKITEIRFLGDKRRKRLYFLINKDWKVEKIITEKFYKNLSLQRTPTKLDAGEYKNNIISWLQENQNPSLKS